MKVTLRFVTTSLFALALTGCDININDDSGASSSDPNTAECACDAAVTKRAASSFEGGQSGLWEIQVDWQGADYCGQEQLCVVDALPAGQSFAGNSADWDCTDTNGEVTCCATDFDPAASFSSHVLELEVAVSSDVEDTTVENCAKLDISDAVEDNNTSCAKGEVFAPKETVDLSIVKGIEGTPVGGDMGHFYFTVTNNGTGPASGVVITDILPDTMTFDDATIGSWSCIGDNGAPETVECHYLSTLAAGASDTLVLPVNVALPSEDQVSDYNCAQVSSDADDVNPEDNESCIDFEIEVPDEICGNCLDDNGDGKVDEDCEYELEVLFTADDEMELFIDGASQGAYQGWSTSDTVTMTITSGTHYVAAHAYDLGGSISGFRAQVSLDGSVLARTGDGSFLGSDTYPGLSWTTSTANLFAGPNTCSYSSGWNINPADLESAGADWIWFSSSSNSCSPYYSDENYIVYSFETCPSEEVILEEEAAEEEVAEEIENRG